MIDALFLSRITFSSFGCCVGSGTGNHFLEHWANKITMMVKYAARHVKHGISNVCVGY